VAVVTFFIMLLNDFPAAMLAREGFLCWSLGMGGSDNFDDSLIEEVLSGIEEVVPSEFCKQVELGQMKKKRGRGREGEGTVLVCWRGSISSERW